MRSRLTPLTLFVAAASITLLIGAGRAIACPFCSAVSQTLRQEMSAMDAVVFASAIQGDSDRNKDSGEVMMRIDRVLKGGDLVKEGQEVQAIYFGDVAAGRRFMLSGVDPPDMQWSCLPVSARAEKYIGRITEIEDDPLARLRFYHNYLADEETMLARDAYDEFAIAPYEVVKALKPEMDHDQLVEWINDTETSTDRKRLYLTMLGVCGNESDLPMLEALLRSTQKSKRAGLDALIACYLTLAGEKGLPLVNELFLGNKQAAYADTYAAIMALRFHGTEGETIARSALVESLHLVLDRKDLADLVIPDLARWNDWTQVDRLTEMFVQADQDNNWIRVPVVNYLRACPLPEAEKALEKLEKIDPESVRRANTFFSIPVQKESTESKSSAVDRDDDKTLAGLVSPHSPRFIASDRSIVPVATWPANPWRLVSVLAMATSTIMIAHFLLLTGGSQPIPE
tara:strand:- start:138200 stop:139567 length:1368 start_codon:yes stop_codon:yes gene_type:complete